MKQKIHDYMARNMSIMTLSCDKVIQKEDAPYLVYPDGSEFWFSDFTYKICHRTDGPAQIYPFGETYWFAYGLETRLPPLMRSDNYSEVWYVNGIDITDAVLLWMNEQNVNSDWREWTDQEKVMFRLKF